MSNSLTLPRPLIQQLFAHAQTEPDNEVCGLISKKKGGNYQLHRIPNTAAESTSRFVMDESQLVSVMQAIRKTESELFAVYHSHPQAEAVPSARDLAEIGYPEAWQLIISLNTKGVLQIRAWRLMDDEAVETALRIIED